MKTIKLMLPYPGILTIITAMIAVIIIAAGCGDNADYNMLSDDRLSDDRLNTLNTSLEPDRISVDELNNLLDNQADIVLVDVRISDEYYASHISGAISMRFPDEMQVRYTELPRDKTIILYCS